MKITHTLVALTLACAVIPAQAANNYPSRSVSFTVPQAAGGAPDILARIVAKELGRQIKQTVIVENRSGAAGAIAAEYVARAPADGYSLLVGSAGIMAIAPHLVPVTGVSLPYKRSDFVPVVLFASLPNVFVASTASPIKSMKDLIAAAKEKPGMAYGSLGMGSTGQISSEMLAEEGGLKLTQVPYRGEAPALADVIGGHVPFMAAGLPTVVGQVQAGAALRPLAITSLKRSTSLPDVPTMDEVGFKGYEVVQWYGLFAPAGTPPDIIKKITKATRTALQSESVVKQINMLGMETATAAQEDFVSFTDAQDKKWGEFVTKVLLKSK